MPIINVQLWAGRSDEAKEQLIEALTDAAVEVLNVDREGVSVIINEVEKKHWGVGGEPSSTKWPD